MRDLSSLFAPKSVAIVGATADTAKLAGKLVPVLKRHNYPGQIYPVNPKYKEVDGEVCYPALSSIGRSIDLALIMIPAEVVPASLLECAKAGVRSAVVLSSGFEESSVGQDLAAQVKQIATDNNLNLVGPNCEGLWSVPHNTILTFGSAAQAGDLVSGPVSVLSQSGSIGQAVVASLQNRGVGCRYFVSVGNETLIGTLDFLEHFVEEGESKVVLIYLEGLKGGERLRDIALRARAKGISIVMLKGGASDRGRKAAASHTGKISAPQEIYRGILRQCGVLQVGTIAELAEAADVLTTAALPATVQDRAGSGIGVLAPGGSRVLISDECDRLNVPLAVFSRETVARLETVIPSYGSAENPVDATGQAASSETMFDIVLGAIDADPAVDAMIVQLGNRGLRRVDELLHSFAELRQRTSGKPIALAFLGDANAMPTETRAKLRAAGLLAAMMPETAVRHLSWLYYSHRALADAASLSAAPPLSGRNIPAPAGRNWDWQQEFLKEAQIPTPRSVVISRNEPIDAAIASLRFPLVAKALPTDVDHKSDEGLVHLGLTDRASLERALAHLFAYKNKALPAVLVQEMIAGGVEAVASLREDADFGPVLSFGVGGTLVEVVKDIVHLSIPCTKAEIEAALRRTKLDTILGGVRGKPAADRAAFINALMTLAGAHLVQIERPAEIEINPLIVLPAGQGVVALDILVTEDRRLGALHAAPTLVMAGSNPDMTRRE